MFTKEFLVVASIIVSVLMIVAANLVRLQNLKFSSYYLHKNQLE